MGEQKKEFTGVWIPKHIIEDEDLSWSEVMLYAEINSFDVCFKNNKSLALRLRLKNKETVSPMLAKLRDKGYIEELGFDGRKKSWKSILDQPKEKVKGRVKEILIAPIRKSLDIDTNIETNIETLTSSPCSDVSEEVNYQPVKEKPAGCPQTYWKNKKREAIGKQPTFSSSELLENIRYFKEQAMTVHGCDFKTLSAPSGKMLKGFKNISKYADLEKMIKWWFDSGGEYADYTPDAFISESTVNKYEAKNNKKPNKSKFPKGVLYR